jgi:hypothetical protein
MLRQVALVLVSPLMLTVVSCAGRESATTTESITTAPMFQTYMNSDAGFAFDYPIDWYHQEFAGAAPFGFGLTTYDPAFPPTQAAPDDPSVISINFGLLPPAHNIESVAEWAVQYRREIEHNNRQLQAEELLTLPSGLQAIHFRVISRSGMTVDRVLVMINGQRLVIGAQGDFQQVRQVLGTLRPL